MTKPSTEVVDEMGNPYADDPSQLYHDALELWWNRDDPLVRKIAAKILSDFYDS